ncbi:hypothetical protein BCR42DRAFT_172679 [Absidia repens]|uniref:Uncharacterized protein n=1 Tax=Absidia repens TaxID=90262 RepID=A0A1X2IV57_9FUNG|nr:hypothetical protein BCR42DRAFT_172679 [Absidia repens]
MRHLFGKEHKERKSKRLVKKLQRQEDKNWHIEQQRRLEQEEKDAALARELQDEVAPDEALINTSDTNATASTPISPTVSSNASAPSPISSPPPPIPLKPAAYYSGLSTSSSSSSNGDQQLWSQETLLLCNSTSSSSSTSQRTVPPPPYQNGQPPLPPRERSISQLSQYNHTSTMQETDACIAYDAFPNFIAASESIRPDPSQLIQRCDPSMFIIPPLHKQPKTTTTCSNPLYPSSAMCMPETEPVGSAPFQCFTTPPYNHTHSTSATAVQAPINQYVPNPTPSISTTISHHSLQGTGIGYSGPAVSPYVSQNATTATATTTMSPCASNHSQLTSMKPDAKPEEQDESDSRSAFPPLANIHQPITQCSGNVMMGA